MKTLNINKYQGEELEQRGRLQQRQTKDLLGLFCFLFLKSGEKIK